jgi:hypothetical protein
MYLLLSKNSYFTHCAFLMINCRIKCLAIAPDIPRLGGFIGGCYLNETVIRTQVIRERSMRQQVDGSMGHLVDEVCENSKRSSYRFTR